MNEDILNHQVNEMQEEVTVHSLVILMHVGKLQNQQILVLTPHFLMEIWA